MYQANERPERWTSLDEMLADQALPTLAQKAASLLDGGVDPSEVSNELARALRSVSGCAQRRMLEMDRLTRWMRRKCHLDSLA